MKQHPIKWHVCGASRRIRAASRVFPWQGSTCVLLLLVFGFAAANSASAQETKAETEIAELLHPFYRGEFSKYDFRLDEMPDEPLELVKTPVMSWQGDGDWLGDVFVWTWKDRPQVIGCIGSWNASETSRGVFHEFHTLAQGPLAVVPIGSKQSWGPTMGLKLDAVTGASAPAKSAGPRAIQMRNVARELIVEMDSESGTHELRLLPQPLYRYASEELGVIDGALFSYVWTNGTDPEFILLIECRRDAAGQRWYYAPARFSYRPITVRRGDAVLWELARHEADYQTLRLSTPYVTLRMENVQLASLKQAADQAPEDSSPENPMP